MSLGWAGRLLVVAGGALLTRAVTRAAQRTARHAEAAARPAPSSPETSPWSAPSPAGTTAAVSGRISWTRVNYRGTEVSLAGGPALAAAAAVAAAVGAPSPGAASAALVAGAGAGSVGLYDDLVGLRPDQRAKGFHGHLAALRQGRITSGVVKLAGAGAAGLLAAALVDADRSAGSLLPHKSAASGAEGHSFPARGQLWLSRGLRTLLGAGVIAGAANLCNLLDLRPGRALKVGLLVGVPLTTGPAGGLAAGPVGAAAGALPDDLAERTMLGDCGANALGALLGTALVARSGPVGRAVALASIAGLTAASERVSFTQVIARTPFLRWLDELGRRDTRPTRQPHWAAAP